MGFKVAITGASGFVGTHLRKRFPQHVVLLRDDPIETIREKMDGVDAAINLAGAPIIKRWTENYKKILIKSRIDTTRKLVRAMDTSNCNLLISTSAVGIYPDNTDCDEDCPNLANDFLGELAKKWEDEALKCKKDVVILRFGVVLGKEGGALKKMLLPFRLGLGGPIGDGSMYMSWIDIEDLVNIYAFLLERGLTGIFNAVSPRPVTNKEFTKTLSNVLKRPALFPVPVILLKIIYGQGATVLTGSKRVFPKRLIEEGFKFKYPHLETSLRHILSP